MLAAEWVMARIAFFCRMKILSIRDFEAQLTMSGQ